jgi:hypothetical protein
MYQSQFGVKWLLCSTRFFCFREFIKTESATAVQCVFHLRFKIQPPTKCICHWNHKFEQTGCLCKGKSSGQPRVSEDNVRHIQESFECSPCKSTCRASRELWIPQPTVWRVLRYHLLFNWVIFLNHPVFGTALSFISPQVQTSSLSPYSCSSSLFSPNLFMISDRRQKDKDSELIGCKHSTNLICLNISVNEILVC